MNTKEKILRESLTLFSTKGYVSVSVREIAKAVGIKESSLYKHYKNKQDIFDCIISEYSSREGEMLTFKNMTSELFEQMSNQIFHFHFLDEINIKLRKLLTMEQYRSDKLSKLFKQLYFQNSIDYQTQLFKTLIMEGYLIKTDPYLLAIEFSSPIFLMLYKFDNNEEDLMKAKDLFIRHIKHFDTIYRMKDSVRSLDKVYTTWDMGNKDTPLYEQ